MADRGVTIPDPDLPSILRHVLDLQAEYSSENTPAMQERGRLVRESGPQRIEQLLPDDVELDPADLRTEGSDGTGRKNRVPWMRVFSASRSPSATRGWYVVYLFAFDGSAVFLSVNQGTSTPSGGVFISRSEDFLRDRVAWARQVLANDLDDYLDEIALLDPGHLGKGYEKGNIAALRYSRDSLPDQEKLRSDLTSVVRLLARLYNAERDPELGKLLPGYEDDRGSHTLDIDAINAYLQAELRRRGLSEVAPVEAEEWLDAARLLPKDKSRPGRNLRDLLRAGQITGQEQGSNQRWTIRLVDDAWDEFVGWMKRFHDWEGFDEEQRQYKIRLASIVKNAREMLATDPSDNRWMRTLEGAFFHKDNNLIYHRAQRAFLTWCNSDLDEAGRAISLLWDDDQDPPNLTSFFERTSSIPNSPGHEISIASFLLFGRDETRFPIYRAEPYQLAFRLTRFGGEPSTEERTSRYHHALSFLDRIVVEAGKRGLQLRDRLDAQGLLFAITSWALDEEPVASWSEEDQRELEAYRKGWARSLDEPKAVEEYAGVVAAPEDYLPDVGPSIEAGPVDLASKVARLVEHLRDRGLIFEPWQVAAFVTAVRTKPLVVLAGISGTGKTKLPRVVAEITGADFRLRPVKPDWTDSGELIGFEALDGTFHPGELLHSARDAESDAGRQHFFLLDEMNLARVEYYLAEILSHIEERRRDPDGNVASDPLAPLAPADPGGVEWKEVRLPGNLCIVGSVNMDETTHGFSRKVLDRTFVLEFGDIDLTQVATLGDATVDEWTVEEWRQRFLALADVPDPSGAPIQRAIEALSDMNKVLEQAQLQVGFRVRDEVALFCLNAEDCIDSFTDSTGAPVDPLDLAISMKVLPRVQGGSGSIRRVLQGLESWAPAYPICAGRIQTMIQRLDEDGFTSFWL